ncbi:MAG: extracellular solute-binding protein [Acidimicrobiales bacterium]
MDRSRSHLDPPQRTPRRRPAAALAAGLAALALAAAGCGSSPSATASGSGTGTPSGTTASGSGSGTATTGAGQGAGANHGNVDVLSAGSLETVLTHTLDPAFHQATGYTAVDTSAGSSQLAAQIKAKTQVADVFLSASPKVDTSLEGAANGSWVSWYATFAKSPLVLEYYPKSKFASALRSKPWYDVITMPGFRVGRTNPAQDPAGKLAVQALQETAAAHSLPALGHIVSDASTEYGETALPGEVASGQLDGAFAYEADARSTGQPWVPLTGTQLFAPYTVTILDRAPHLAAAEAFVRFLLGTGGHSALGSDGFLIVSPPALTGTGVPAGLQSILRS